MESNRIIMDSDLSRDAAEQAPKRNYGIDLLRVLSMLYVVMLHTLGRGGALNAASKGTIQYQVSWFLEIWAYGAVDIFALISGYVAFSPKAKRTNYSKYIMLWMQVVFYSLGVTLVYRVLYPDLVTKGEIIRQVFPFTNDLYWYFSAYTALFVIMPVLNAGIRKCSEEYLSKLFVLMILVFSVYNTFVKRFHFNNGYSFLWITLLYILGAIMKKCKIGENIKGYQSILIIILCAVITWAWRLYGITAELTSEIEITKSMLVNYTSPMVLISAIFHIILFSKMKFKNISQKIISFMGAGAFSVYILNCQICVWKYIMKDRFKYLGQSNPMTIVIHTLAFSAAFVICAILIDSVRRWLFKGFRANVVADLIAAIVDKVVSLPIARKYRRKEVQGESVENVLSE